MREKKLDISKLWLIGIIVAVIVFIWGLLAWIMASQYVPKAPASAPLIKYSNPKQRSGFPITKYQSLMSGKLFFGSDGGQFTRNITFTSKLILQGLIHGAYALVTIDPLSNENTKIVKAGDTIEGEQIIAVGEDSITVRNQTGEGKIHLRN